MINFKFADIGEGIHEGVVLKWHYDVGDTVEEGETIVVIETDKVNAEIPAPESGILKKKGAEVGETIHVGEVLAVIDDGSGDDEEEAPNDESAEKAEKPTDNDASDDDDDDDDESSTKTESAGESGASVVGSVEVSDEVMPASNEHSASKQEASDTKKALATPFVRKLAKDKGIDINTIKGSGPEGRVMKKDVEASDASSEQTASSSAKTTTTRPSYDMPKVREDGTRREKITKLRQSIVKAMDRSNALIPATTVMDEFDVSEMVKFREKQKNIVGDDVKITYLPLIMKAVLLTLKEFPVFNASFDHENEEIIYKDYYNIGIAVDTPDGLIVPNIKDADQKSIIELAKESQSLAQKARDRKVSLDDLKDTTFSVTNYGAFGAKLGTPVINHPEVAILGMGAIEKKPVVIDGEIEVRDIFPVSLSVDHRIIDGGDAGRFMVKLKAYLNDPMLLLLS